MKKAAVVTLVAFCLAALPVQSGHANPILIITEIVKKVILAIDQRIQRLQNKTIGLQNAQKFIENALSKLKLEEISEWTEKQRSQYQEFFDGLWKVKSAINTYKKVREIMERQIGLVKEYQRAFSLFRNDSRFTAEEIDYMFRVYSGIIDESLKSIEQVLLVVNSFKTQMADGQRLQIINDAATAMEKVNRDLREFNNQNMLMSFQRARDQQEVEALKRWYGLP